MEQRKGTAAAQKDQIHKRRRARNDPNNRDYGCPCGKNYLSYPALYTHIKQKHNGQAPGQISRPSIQTSKRGRPTGSTRRAAEEEGSDHSDDRNSNDALNIIEELVVYLHMSFQNVALLDNAVNTTRELLQAFPREDVFPSGDYYERIETCFREALDGAAPPEDAPQDENTVQTVCNRVFANFLVAAAKQLTVDVVRELAVFVCLVRRALNERGWELLHGAAHGAAMHEYCESNSGARIVDIMNTFITDLLPQYVQEIRTGGMRIVTPQTINSHVIRIAQYFCNWVYYKSYSNSQLILNEKSESGDGAHSNDDVDTQDEGQDQEDDEDDEQGIEEDHGDGGSSGAPGSGADQDYKVSARYSRGAKRDVGGFQNGVKYAYTHISASAAHAHGQKSSEASSEYAYAAENRADAGRAHEEIDVAKIRESDLYFHEKNTAQQPAQNTRKSKSQSGTKRKKSR